ncbi:hypothetical protein ACHAPT_009603 [Fusarium lateritium]
MDEAMDEIKDHILYAPNFNEVYPLLPWPRGQRRLGIFTSYPRRSAIHPPPGVTPILLCQPERVYNWSSIQVVGLKVDADFGYQQGVLELYKSAREIFRSQPTRLFLHGFYVYGSFLERWVIDRFGMYCSSPTYFDPSSIWPGTIVNQLICDIIQNYQWMSDSELGQNPSVHLDDLGSYVLIQGRGCSVHKLYLERKPIVCPQKVVSRYTTCYRASIMGSGYEYVVKFSWRSRSRSPEEQRLQLANERNVRGVVQLIDYHVVDSSFDRRQSLMLQRHYEFPTADPGTTSSRTMSCLVITPFGRPISQFKDIPELLEAFRDAIKAHRSLFFDGGILHRDISTGNIIIPNVKREGEPRGILIDLDLSTEVADLASIAGHVIGTKPFISVDLIKCKQHSCLHDLDSFFFVFLWVIICRDDDPPRGSVLGRWSSGSYDDLAVRKAKDISPANFHRLVSEFPPEFKCLSKLAYELRDMVDIQGRHMSRIGQAYQVKSRYVKMIDAFQTALQDYRAGKSRS